MEYRLNRKSGDELSVIGLGTGAICSGGEREAVAALHYAYEHGVNLADLATANAKAFTYFGTAFGGRRERMRYQVHFGANYETGEYGWTTDLETVKRAVEWQLHELKTDFIDYGFIHCLDGDSDWQAYEDNGVLAYLLEMKQQGVVRHIGLSSHTPALAQRALDTGVVEQLMFSINPAYDYHHGEFANGSARERTQLYLRCQAEGVGITVMKPFSAGQLLDEKTSPFGVALTPYQCIQYALDKPGVVSVLPGVATVEDVKQVLGYLDAPAQARDYSALSAVTPKEAAGVCVYCNHCQPCPAWLNVGLINKYYDLALAGDPLAAGHYEKLDRHAGDCLDCGHCDSRCPFRVAQGARMKEIAAHFGK